jgi:hypothetical protein
MSSIPNQNPNVITAAGAVTPGRLNHINAAGALALTLALPTVDGQIVSFIDETGHAHVITVAAVGSPPTSGLNGGSNTTLTFNGPKGSAVELVGRNGNWFTGPLTGVAVA